MVRNHFLNLARKHILARDDQHLFDAPSDEQESVIINATHVAGLEVPMFIKDAGRQIRKVVVALHDIGALDSNFAVFISTQHPTIRRNDPLFYTRQRTANRMRSVLLWQAPIGAR